MYLNLSSSWRHPYQAGRFENDAEALQKFRFHKSKLTSLRSRENGTIVCRRQVKFTQKRKSICCSEVLNISGGVSLHCGRLRIDTPAPTVLENYLQQYWFWKLSLPESFLTNKKLRYIEIARRRSNRTLIFVQAAACSEKVTEDVSEYYEENF